MKFPHLQRIAVAVLCGAVLFGAEERAKFAEHEVKASFLSHVTDFVTWPGKASGDVFTIGVLGDDPFGNDLEKAVRGQTVSGQKVAIKRGAKVDAMRGCQILFIARSERSHLGEILGKLQTAGILTVSDLDDFTNQGGMIGLFVKNKNGKDTLCFHINTDAAKRSGLRLRAQFIKIAE